MEKEKIDTIKGWNKSFEKNVDNQQFDDFTNRQLDLFLSYLDKNSKILDIGCGNGRKTNYIFEKGFNVKGIDGSKIAIDFAKENFSKIDFFLGDILNTKFEKNSFNGIFSMAVMHCFLEEEREKYVKEINRLLKKNGILYQLLLSSKDETKINEEKIEENTYCKKGGVPFHLFNENELKNYFFNYEFLYFNENINKLNDKTISVFTMVLRKLK